MFGSRVSRRKNNTKASERKRGVKMDLLDLFQEDLTTDLTEQEVTLLNECESVISKGIKAFKEVWGALLEVRDSRLYRKEFRTFEDYCVVKWNLSKRYINRNLKALDTLNNLGPIGPHFETERQLRPLTNLEPEIQRQVVKDVQEINPKAPTSLIQDVVNQYGGINAVLKELKLNPDLVFESEQDLINKAKSLIPAPAPLVQEVIKHVEIIKDGELMDKLEEKDIYINQLKSSLSDKNKELSQKDMSIRDSQAKLKDVELLEVEIKELKKKVESSNDIELNDLINHKEELKKEIEYDLKGFDLKDKLIKAKTEFINSTKEIILTKSENINYEFLKPLAQDLNNLVQEWLINFQKTYI